MNQNSNTKLPKWPLKFLRFFVKKEYLEEIEGDMEELFLENIHQFSHKRARRIYAWEILKLFRLPIIRNIEINYSLNQYGMYKNYLKTSLRGLKKNMLFSSINIIGLAISMSVGILMILLLSELNSFDDFHAEKNTIYKVTTTRVQGLSGNEVHLSSSSFYIGNQLKESVPGIEKVLLMNVNELSADLRTEEKAIGINGFYASDSFFDVFSFKLKQGNPKSALANPNSIILTESSAKELFGDTNPIGETISVEENSDFQEGIITGIVEDPPVNSHMRFDALVSLNTLKKPVIDEENDINSPDDINNSLVYIVLNEHTTKEEVENAMATIMSDYNKSLEHPITHLLQPMDTFVTSDVYNNGMGPMFSQRKINIMLGLTFIILLSACFNYTNLSLARALRRSKEVGIRKVMGANRFQVFAQFMVEALLLALLALVVGLGLFFIIRPEFLNLPNPAAMGYDMFSLKINYINLLYFLLFAIGLGLLAGFQPALFLSKYKALNAFNDARKTKVFTKGINLRHVLTGFQFTISMGLIICAVLVHKQYKFSLNYDLGYKTENIVNIPIQGDYANLLENEYGKIPEVVETSKSSWVLGTGGEGMSVGMVMSKENPKPAPFLLNIVDDTYLSMHELEFLAGSGFIRPLGEGQSPTHIIVNEEALKTLNIDSPEEAIGKTILYNGAPLQIQGVVKDFIRIALTKDIFKSFAFVQTNKVEQYKSLNVKIASNNITATLKKLEEEYKKLGLLHPFEAHFYDDQIANVYEQEKTTYTLISFLAFLAISISTLGLLGMAVYTMESRKKEISIRKVLGAGIRNLTALLSREFTVIILLSSLIAIPITLYIVDTKVLNEFNSYRIEIGLIDSLSGIAVMIIIGALTIGWQIRLAFVKNPSDTLRNE